MRTESTYTNPAVVLSGMKKAQLLMSNAFLVLVPMATCMDALMSREAGRWERPDSTILSGTKLDALQRAPLEKGVKARDWPESTCTGSRDSSARPKKSATLNEQRFNIWCRWPDSTILSGTKLDAR